MRPGALLLLLGAAVLAGCRAEPLPPDAVARVGEAVLTQEDLRAALSVLPPGTDSTFARTQVVEQWVTHQLLALEARRRNLRDDPTVRQQLEDAERQVLAEALLARLYDEERAGPSQADVEAYFQRHRDRLRLREPFVRVRFVETRTASAAERARAALTAPANGIDRDSVYVSLVRRFAVDSTAAFALAGSYIPQARLTRQTGPSPWTAVAQLAPGETSAVLPASDTTFVVIQLVERLPAGAEPQLAWVEPEVRQRLLIQNRQQTVAREVQRLRLEAEARGDLRVDLPDGP